MKTLKTPEQTALEIYRRELAIRKQNAKKRAIEKLENNFSMNWLNAAILVCEAEAIVNQEVSVKKKAPR